MNLQRMQRSLPALVIVGALLSGSWVGAQGSQGRSPDYGASAPQEDSHAPPAAPAPVRRMRASLSMPYFSFAHPLRPRS
ncbi:hypothetical protein FZ025_17825 [Xanthomonas hyacinthi]|uniref:Uncharacterized protein n=1 Tax=Xanthomonas hyacinthi TaxID=56455 RepID=A0A2S7F207_9XANT|nr:hypothetical protein [Xanthomonas hyacinthi]KLD75476.1 hypothetical protein Y886_26725 [Xanthomonas hyacinthi DSM 19077]PPU99408.1 hypothetical protein XhyaCFBP1156_03860 [Xanthomonas hyacinthi]QGY78405.1 hypothetical protein FZ025_17825 [Xanthomonas hyacinthi]